MAAAVALDPPLRSALGARWTFRGLVYVQRHNADGDSVTAIDRGAIDSTAAIIGRLFSGPIDPDRLSDPAGRYLVSLLECPTLAKLAATGSQADSTRLLASRCNFR